MKRYICFEAPSLLPQSVTDAFSAPPNLPLFCLDNPAHACGVVAYDPVLHTYYAIVQGDGKACTAWLHKTFGDLLNADWELDTEGCKGCHYWPGDNVFVIWLSTPSKERDGVYIFSVMAHEALHAALRSGGRVGIKPDPNSEEWYCYCVQFITAVLCGSIGHINPDASELPNLPGSEPVAISELSSVPREYV